MANILKEITLYESKGFTKSEAIAILQVEQLKLNNQLLSEALIQAPNGKRYIQTFRG